MNVSSGREDEVNKTLERGGERERGELLSVSASRHSSSRGKVVHLEKLV